MKTPIKNILLAISLALGLGACSAERAVVKEDVLNDVVETAKEAGSSLVLTLVYHDLKGHGETLNKLGIGYDFALGPKETEFGTVKGDWGGMPAGIFGKAELSEEQTDSLRISGLRATQDLYYDLNKKLGECANKGEDKTLDHWMALFAGTDFMSYYVRDRFVSERNGYSDISGLLERGYKNDIDGAFVAQLIGEGPDLVWHLARGMRLKMSKPEIYKFGSIEILQ